MQHENVILSNMSVSDHVWDSHSALQWHPRPSLQLLSDTFVLKIKLPSRLKPELYLNKFSLTPATLACRLQRAVRPTYFSLLWSVHKLHIPVITLTVFTLVFWIKSPACWWFNLRGKAAQRIFIWAWNKHAGMQEVKQGSCLRFCH